MNRFLRIAYPVAATAFFAAYFWFLWWAGSYIVGRLLAQVFAS